MSHDQKLLDAQIAIEMPEGEWRKGQQKEEGGRAERLTHHTPSRSLLRQRDGRR